MRHLKSVNWKEIFHLKNITLNLVGVAFITLALKGFMMPNKFLDGGVTGISILLHEISHIPFGILVLVLNIPFLYIGKKILGNTFAIQSLFTFILIAASMTFIEVDAVTSDRLLIALFGGCLIGVGMGLCIRSGSVADGIEILALLTTRKIGLNISEVIFAINSTVFFSCCLVFWYKYCFVFHFNLFFGC